MWGLTNGGILVFSRAMRGDWVPLALLFLCDDVGKCRRLINEKKRQGEEGNLCVH